MTNNMCNETFMQLKCLIFVSYVLDTLFDHFGVKRKNLGHNIWKAHKMSRIMVL